jgi:hypothetical protein
MLTVEILSFPLSGPYCPANIPQLNSLNSTEPAWGPPYIDPGGPSRKHRSNQFFYCCYRRLPSDSPDIVDVFTCRYQATHVPSRDRCIATVLHVAIYNSVCLRFVIVVTQFRVKLATNVRALTRRMNSEVLFQCIVPIVWVLVIFWCGYVMCSVLYNGNCLRLTVHVCYSWERP